MSEKLDGLKAKYPEHKVKYEPQETCDACGGTGEQLNGLRETTLCICTCVELEGIGGLFKDHVDKQLKDLREETPTQKD